MKYLSVIDTKTNKFQHYVEDWGWCVESESDGPSLFSVKENPSRLTNGWKEGFRVVPVEFKYTEKKPKVKKPKLEDELVDAYKEIFRLEPDLQAIPIFGWGRYFKYELAGDSFEKSNEDGFASMVRSLDLYEHVDEAMMEKIDTKYEKELRSGGPLRLLPRKISGGEVIYNGIAKTDLRSRIKQHLFSADNMNFGALSMDINITYNKFATKRVFEITYDPDNDYIDEYGKYYGKYNRSIPYFIESGWGTKRMLSKEQAIENLYLDNKEKEFIIKEEGAVTFRNGINITQPKHKDFEFRVYVIGIANEGYRNYIEKNWRKYHGKPQLCKR